MALFGDITGAEVKDCVDSLVMQQVWSIWKLVGESLTNNKD